MSTRASAISAAGTVLSQPTRQTSASKSCAWAISSIESAITSRETSDARMPGVPCDWLSETAIVLNGSGTPPAAATPSQTCRDSSSWLRLHGIVPVHVEQMPTIGPSSRAGSMPIARKCARAPARSGAGREPGAGAAAERVLRRRVTRDWVHVWLGACVSAYSRPRGINGAILGARTDDAPFDGRRRRFARPRPRAVLRAGARDRARARLVRGAARRRRRSMPSTSRCPHALHHTWTMRALAAGKHVLVEKPYTRHPRRSTRRTTRRSGSGLVLSEGYMWRHSRQTRLCSASCCRAWGRSRRFRRRSSGSCRGRRRAVRARELGGGALLDLGCYCCSAARLVLARAGRASTARHGSAAAGSTSDSPPHCGSATWSQRSSAASLARTNQDRSGRE